MNHYRSRSRRAAVSRRRSRLKFRLRLEMLEQRVLLAGDLPGDVNWFESFAEVPRKQLEQLAVDVAWDPSTIGPRPLQSSEWVVQLREEASSDLTSLGELDVLLDVGHTNFTVIAGLGMQGGVLLRAEGLTTEVVADVLSKSDDVVSFTRNQLIEGQATTPSDPEFTAGLLQGLQLTSASVAWDETIGDLNTVVGIVDSGIDAAHADLYLNVWLNQGELPPKYLDGDGNTLVDIDGDGLITFYDLNHATRDAAAPFELTVSGFQNGPNAEFVRDLNSNGRIDALDLLEDANWADGRDTDENGFFDDLFGVNFRSGADDPFATNNPSDELGHGTHVSGTIGAIGGNASGVVGMNWQTSLMSLRILDNNNQGDSGAAIRAVNYARQMRERYRVDDSGRVIDGANVRVLNNSWGQPGGFEASLEAAINDSGDAGILFVAAAGNGNFLGQGVDNDRTPFYPASYDSPSVISVAATDQTGRRASFSNFGSNTVDITAPGVGIRSTVPGNGYQSANGTSMATPHVAGTAALIWSALPEATVEEVRQAILGSVDVLPQLGDLVSTSGRLNAARAITADVFAPAARLIAKQDIATAGGGSTEFTVEYSHRSGINVNTIGDDDLVVVRQWGPADQIAATLKVGSVVPSGSTAIATYVVAAPGGSWDAFDFGDYAISTNAGNVATTGGNRFVEARDIGSFRVQVEDTSILYVDSYGDSIEDGSLRSAIMAANVATIPTTIILDSGRFTIDIPSVADAGSTFPESVAGSYCGARQHVTGWSNETTGDFDITGDVTIVGNQNDATILDARSLDRVFKVHPGASLQLQRVQITGGVSPSDQGGGGILSAGELTLTESVVLENFALGANAQDPIRGGGVAVWGGTFDLLQTWVTENESDFGGGVFVCNSATGTISQSTLSENQGGGLHSQSDGDIDVTSSTFSANEGGRGAIFNGKRDGFEFIAGVTNETLFPVLDANASSVVFASRDPGLVAGDNNGMIDVFVYQASTDSIQQISVGMDGQEANGNSGTPAISADGSLIAFYSSADNLVPDDTNGQRDLFVYDRGTKEFQRAGASGGTLSVDGTGDAVVFGFNSVRLFEPGTGQLSTITGTGAGRPDISENGRFVVFESTASNLVANDTNGVSDIFVFDRQTSSFQRVSHGTAATEANGSSQAPTISGDGRYVTFESTATNLTLDDQNSGADVFLFDRNLGITTRVSASPDSTPENNGEFLFPRISSDGQYITFASDASNLVSSDANSARDVFLYDRVSGSITLSSVNTSGASGNAETRFAQLNSDGRFTAFSSAATDLVARDTNGNQDVFLRDHQTMTTRSLTSPEIISTIRVSQSTIAETSGSLFTVTGQVELDDVLLTREVQLIDVARVVSTNLVQSVGLGANLVGDLTQFGRLPPVHPLLRGNPAIDAGNPVYAGSVDQVGNLRVQPDVGAYEVLAANISGSVFVDLNANQQRDAGEPGFAGVDVTSAVRGQVGDRTSVSGQDSVATPFLDETGSYQFENLDPSLYDFAIETPENFVLSQGQIQRLPTSGNTNGATLSGDGRYVVFQSSSDNLVPDDTNGQSDVFRLDRTTGVIERVNVGPNGVQSAPARTTQATTNDEGRFIAFESEATNLISSGGTGMMTVYVRDVLNGITMRVGQNDGGVAADRSVAFSIISGDGGTVAFISTATNLVPGDTNGATDVFVFDIDTQTIQRITDDSLSVSGPPALSRDGRFVTYVRDGRVYVFDRDTQTTEVVSVDSTGAAATGNTPTISADGRFVAFASNELLVPGMVNSLTPIYVYDRTLDSIEALQLSNQGQRLTNQVSEPSISADGRFVTFETISSQVVAGDANNAQDVFVHDRLNSVSAIVSVSATGVQSETGDVLAKLSADGRFIVFESASGLLTPDDNNNTVDVFVLSNPLIEEGVSRLLVAGDSLLDFDFGLIPSPGDVSGRVFDDVIQNSTYDVGESGLAGWTVFIDANGNRHLDETETSVVTDSDGMYRFVTIPGFRDHSIAAQSPAGWQQISPGANANSVWSLFLPAGGDIAGRDFAFRRIESTGQSSASAVSGRLYDDVNGNGAFDVGVDLPLAGREVYLDAANFGIRDPDEPRELTAPDGSYSFNGLSSRNVAVTTSLDQTLVHTSPLGSDFALAKYPLFKKVAPFGNPQAIAAGDFNADGFSDVVVALGEANQLSIRLNDQAGGFLPNAIDIDLGTTGAGPTAMVLGQFDDDVRLDLAVTANFAGNVVVLLNFDPASGSFSSRADLAVGEEPIDIVAGQFAGDEKFDLIVVNNGNAAIAGDESLNVLTNNGSGIFSVGPSIPTGGVESTSIVAGDFTGDASMDVAVVHARPNSPGTPLGGATVLAGDGNGGLSLQSEYYTLGALPIDSVTSDFNGDGRDDIAVANFSSNSISVLLGQNDGTFRVQESILGTASGAFDIAVGDIDNDGDVDLIASNLRDRNISIFRNVAVDPGNGEVRFEPLENIGLGQFSLAQRMPLVVANFDNDASGPNRSGTIDIVTIPQKTDTLHVLRNRLVDGPHRVALTGLNAVVGLDFLVKPAVILPTIDPLASPISVIEDAPETVVPLTGIKKGRDAGPDLRFTVASSHPNLVAGATVDHAAQDTNASLRFTPVANANGDTLLTLVVTDAGADQVFDTADDGVVTRSLAVTVQPVNDPPTFVLPTPRSVRIDEDSGAQSINGFANAISPGGGEDEALQNLTPFVLTTDNDALFSSLPSLDSNGRLSFTSASNAVGNAFVTATLSDDGGKLLGGQDSQTANFVISVQSVNDSPLIILAGDQSAPVGAGAQTINDFATSFAAGGGDDESLQVPIAFVVQNDNPALFASAPTIDTSGSLRYTPSGNQSGTANVTVQVQDSGGRDRGGIDLSAQVTFAITLTSNSIVLSGTGETLDLSLPSVSLDGVNLIDIGGTGDNVLVINASRIATAIPQATIRVLSDAGDSIVFDDGWKFTSVEFAGVRLVRRFQNAGIAIEVVGPRNFTNPIDRYDVDGSTTLTPNDALVVINAISDGHSIAPPDVPTFDLEDFGFFDVFEDEILSPADILEVLNELSQRRSLNPSGALGESPRSDSLVQNRPTVDSRRVGVDDLPPHTWPHTLRPAARVPVAGTFGQIEYEMDFSVDPKRRDSAQSNGRFNSSALNANQIDTAFEQGFADVLGLTDVAS